MDQLKDYNKKTNFKQIKLNNMKRFLIIAIAFLALQMNAQTFEPYGQGWIFESSMYEVTTLDKKSSYYKGRTNIYFNRKGDNLIELQHPNGELEFYKLNLSKRSEDGVTEAGNSYTVFSVIDIRLNKKAEIQLVKGTSEFIRVHFIDGFITYY